MTQKQMEKIVSAVTKRNGCSMVSRWMHARPIEEAGEAMSFNY
jgi:hypothetical protein